MQWLQNLRTPHKIFLKAMYTNYNVASICGHDRINSCRGWRQKADSFLQTDQLSSSCCLSDIARLSLHWFTGIKWHLNARTTCSQEPLGRIFKKITCINIKVACDTQRHKNTNTTHRHTECIYVGGKNKWHDATEKQSYKHTNFLFVWSERSLPPCCLCLLLYLYCECVIKSPLCAMKSHYSLFLLIQRNNPRRSSFCLT